MNGITSEDQPNRKSPRLREFDYSTAGGYFITICVHDRRLLFGRIADDECTLNPAGEMIVHWWRELANKFADICLDEAIVMPNHLHGIILINDHSLVGAAQPVRNEVKDGHPVENDPQFVGAALCGRPQTEDHAVVGATLRGRPDPETKHSSLTQIMDWFKTMTTNAYIRGVRSHEFSPFSKSLWQRSYHDRIIRTEKSLNAIRQYIVQNPRCWALDIENPDRLPKRQDRR